MSTYHDSKIRHTKRQRKCEEPQCGATIEANDPYLDYRPGLYAHHRVCISCAMKNDSTGGFRFACLDVLKRANKVE